jgi:hypothetical protein
MAVYGDNDLYFTWVFVAKRLNNSKLFKDKRKRILIEKSLNERLEYRYKRKRPSPPYRQSCY